MHRWVEMRAAHPKHAVRREDRDQLTTSRQHRPCPIEAADPKLPAVSLLQAPSPLQGTLVPAEAGHKPSSQIPQINQKWTGVVNQKWCSFEIPTGGGGFPRFRYDWRSTALGRGERVAQRIRGRIDLVHRNMAKPPGESIWDGDATSVPHPPFLRLE